MCGWCLNTLPQSAVVATENLPVPGYLQFPLHLPSLGFIYSS